MPSLLEENVGCKEQMTTKQYIELCDKVFCYVEKFFARSGNTAFPTVRQVARAINLRQNQVIEIVEDNDRLMLTYWNVDHHVTDGERFVESLGDWKCAANLPPP